MSPAPVRFHSILLRAGADAFADNHRAYCARRGYTHRLHAIGTPHNSARTLLVYKYSVVSAALADAPDGTLLVFADDDAAFLAPLPAPAVIGDAAHWIAENEHHHRPEGSCFMLRAGPEATALVNAVLDRLRIATEADTDRWAHRELEGIAAHPHHQLIDGRHYPNLLFARFGHYLPEVSAFVLSFNPAVHVDVQDRRVRGIFVDYLNTVLARDGRLYDDLPPPPTGQPDYAVRNTGRPVALLTSYTPNIAGYATLSERNIAAYADHHGYTHHVYRDLPADLRGRVAGNWIKPRLLLKHLAEHEQVAWVDADILIHDRTRPLASLLRGRPVALARDVSGYEFNSGFMVFSNTPACIAYLERVQALIDEVADKSGIYLSGGDQAFFVAAWREAGGEAAMPLSDGVSFNSHPALQDSDSFMLHYMGYPDRFRAVVMGHDALRIEQGASRPHDTKAPAALRPARRKPRLHFTHLHGMADIDQFDDIVESYRLAAEALGYETRFSPHQVDPDPDAVNVVFFAWQGDWRWFKDIHSRCIIVNFEHLTPGNFCFTEGYRATLGAYYVWEYSLANFQKNIELGLTASDHVPLAYQRGAGAEPAADAVLPDAEQDIDVVFFGATTPRRVQVLEALIARGVRVVLPMPKPWRNAERDAHLRRAKVVINMHQLDNSRIVEIPRLTVLLRNRKAVVCELYPDSDIDPSLRDAVEGAPWEGLVDATLRLLANPARRAELERVGYERLTARAQTRWLGPALDRFFQWQAQQPGTWHEAAQAQRFRVAVAIAAEHAATQPLPGLAAQVHCELAVIRVTSAAHAGEMAAHPDDTIILLPGQFNRANARDAAIRQADADYLVFWDNDDTAAPDRLHRQAAFLAAHPEIDIVGSWLEEGEGETLQMHRAPELDHEIRAEFLGTDRVLRAGTCMYRREFLVRHHLRHDEAFDGDLEGQYFLHRCATAGARLAAIAAPLCRRDVPTPNGDEALAASDAAVRSQHALLRGYFPSLAAHAHEQLAQMRAAYWPPDAAFAVSMLTRMAQVAALPSLSPDLERATLARVLRREAVRLILRYRMAGLIDAAWLAQRMDTPEVAYFLAPARDQLIGKI
ncbi:MAG: glycosyltransferase [Pseudomonadota bacterium]